MKAGEFKQFIENVKHKTGLTPWLLSIKENPKDSLTYLTLSDFLGDQGGLSTMAGDYLRLAVNTQTKEATQDHKVDNDLQTELNKLGKNIADEFKKTGIEIPESNVRIVIDVPKKLTQHHVRDNNPAREYRAIINRKTGIPKMSLTVQQTRDRPTSSQSDIYPYLKRNLSNNVAWHDLNDYNVQLYGIFLIAQKIATHLLMLAGNEQVVCGEDGRLDLTFLFNGLVTNSWTDEDQTELVLSVDDYKQIFPYLQNSWNCCDKFTKKSVEHLENSLHYIDEETLRDLDMYRLQNWAARQIITRWLDAVESWKLQGCKGYRERISSIIRDFRNYNKVYIMHRDRNHN